MQIVICGSMSSASKMVECANKLKQAGHEIILPHNAEKYALGRLEVENRIESTQNKITNDLIRDYFNKIKNADAILVVNVDKNEIKNYIGGNAFLEIGFAHCLNKKIFLLNNIPQMLYTDEILAMQPIVLNGDLSKI